jgi:hypothetical protein
MFDHLEFHLNVNIDSPLGFRDLESSVEFELGSTPGILRLLQDTRREKC